MKGEGVRQEVVFKGVSVDRISVLEIDRELVKVVHVFYGNSV